MTTNEERLGILEDWRTRTDEWQREQNGHLKNLAEAHSKLADSYATLATCASNDRAYRKGRIDTMKLLVGLAGTGGAASLAAVLIQLFT